MNYREEFRTLDRKIIHHFQAISIPFARIALFVVFFWFGILKVVHESPANPLVAELLEKTLPFLTFDQFIIIFGLFEMLIGILFLVPRMERIVLPLLGVHMITTIAPLVLLPTVTWTAPLVPTLEGQYIIKNIVLIALACVIGANLRPWKK